MGLTTCSNCGHQRVRNAFACARVCVGKSHPRRRCMNSTIAPNSSAAGAIHWLISTETLAPAVNTALNKSCRPLTTGWLITDNGCHTNTKPMASVILGFRVSFAASVNRSSTMADLANFSSLLAKFTELSQRSNRLEIISVGWGCFISPRRS
jgi:hypothetical protein